jgi:predicted GNAT family acetyltransferase
VADPLLDNPRGLAEKVAGILGGTATERAGLSGFLSSDFDPFLNHLFASESVSPRDAAEALDDRPGFVWLVEEPDRDQVGTAGAERLHSVEMMGMTAATAPRRGRPHHEGEIGEVRSQADLDGWHDVYCEVFGGDPRGRDEWGQIHESLGRSGDGLLLLLLARVDGSPAATAAVFFQHDLAGLYCFTMRDRMRGRGLASALVHASHEEGHRARALTRHGAGQIRLCEGRIPGEAVTLPTRLTLEAHRLRPDGHSDGRRDRGRGRSRRRLRLPAAGAAGQRRRPMSSPRSRRLSIITATHDQKGRPMSREAIVTRVFDAPRETLWRYFTEAELSRPGSGPRPTRLLQIASRWTCSPGVGGVRRW